MCHSTNFHSQDNWHFITDYALSRLSGVEMNVHIESPQQMIELLNLLQNMTQLFSSIYRHH